MSAVAVVAVRGGPMTKSRLAGRLDSEQREKLVAAMLADMLSVLSRCPSVRRTYVTTPTLALAQLAMRRGASVLVEHGADGLNQAFDRARRHVAAADPQAAVMLLPGDLPRLRADDVEACLAATGPARVILAPADADGGTGALVLPAGAPLSLAFGCGSFDKHVTASRASGLEPLVVRAPSLGFDLDAPADLDAFLALSASGVTAALLHEWRVAA